MTWNLDSETVARLGRQQFFRNIDAAAEKASDDSAVDMWTINVAPEKKGIALDEDGRRPRHTLAAVKEGIEGLRGEACHDH